MPLIECPDCGRKISDTAPSCIGCGRPMERSLLSAEPTQIATESQRDGVYCKVCGSSDVRKVPVVYEAGTSHVTTETQGTAVGFVGDELAAGSMSGRTAGRSQTELAKRLTPPAKLPEDNELLGGLGCLTVIGLALYLGVTAGGDTGWVVFGIGTVLMMIGIGTGVFKFKAAVRWNEEKYPRLYAAWQRSFVCMRCGAITDPEAG